MEFIIKDPYANAFNFKPLKSPWFNDSTYKYENGKYILAMTLDLWERKYEIDSLTSFLKLSVNYYNSTKNSTIFND